MQKGNSGKYLIKLEINSQSQIEFFNENGFVYVLGLFRNYRYMKDAVNIFYLDKFIAKGERYYCTRFHSIQELDPTNSHYLEPYLNGSGFGTVQGWFEYMKREKPNAHYGDLWVVYLIIKKEKNHG